MIRPPSRSTIRTDVYEIRPRADKHGVDLVSDALPYSPMWYRGPKAIRDAIDHAKFSSRSRDVAIRVYDEAGNVIETHEHAGDLTGSESAPETTKCPSIRQPGKSQAAPKRPGGVERTRP